MVDFSFLEKLNQLKDIALSSPFFFASLLVGIILLVIMIIGIKKNRRINKIIFIISWIFVLGFVIFKYFNFIVSIFDRFFGRIVEELYFPSLSIYTLMLISINIVFVYSTLKKNLALIFRISNIATAMELDLLFVLILDVITKSEIDIYSKIDVYSDPKLMVLLEFSMFIFMFWLLLIGLLILIRKYAVRTVFVNLFKESDYEVIDISEDNDDIIDLEDSSENEEIIDL